MIGLCWLDLRLFFFFFVFFFLLHLDPHDFFFVFLDFFDFLVTLLYTRARDDDRLFCCLGFLRPKIGCAKIDTQTY